MEVIFNLVARMSRPRECIRFDFANILMPKRGQLFSTPINVL